MNTQTLESLASLGLLVFLRAKLTDNAYNMPRFEVLDKSIKKQSIFSHLLLREVSSAITLNVENMHSPSAPDTYLFDLFFEKYKQYATYPWCDYTLDKIETSYYLPAKKQWNYEFSKITKENNVTLSIDPLHYCGRSDDEHYKVFSPLISEAYLSSYLRTLAWLVFKGLPEREIFHLAAQVFPINLDLWKVEPNPRPIIGQ